MRSADLDVEACCASTARTAASPPSPACVPTSRYGEMTVDGDRVVEFHEKPRDGMALVSGGFFVFERRFLDYLDADPQLFLELAPLQRLAREASSAPTSRGRLVRDGHLPRLSAAHRIWNEGSPPWKIWK
jgi:glucose-1-phosphate cytidylyltransferase